MTTTTDNTPIHCNIFNPLKCRRVIYDGLNGYSNPIVIDAGETKYSCTISTMVANELRQRNGIKQDSDLIVITPATEPPTAQESLREKYRRLIDELDAGQ